MQVSFEEALSSSHLARIFSAISEKIASASKDGTIEESVGAALEEVAEQYRYHFFGSWFQADELLGRIIEVLGLSLPEEEALERCQDKVLRPLIAALERRHDPEQGLTWLTLDTCIEGEKDFIRRCIADEMSE